MSSSEKKTVLTVVAALIEKEGRLLLCQRQAHDAFALLWEFPGGTVKTGETLTDGIRREIKEELNIDIEPLSCLGVFEDEDETLKIIVHLFTCDHTGGVLRPVECNAYRFVTLDTATTLALAPVDKKIARFLRQRNHF